MRNRVGLIFKGVSINGSLMSGGGVVHTRCSVSRLLLTVLVLLAVGGEALGLQQLRGCFSLAEGALVVLQEPLLLLQGGFLVGVEALQLLEAALELRWGRCGDGLDVAFWLEPKALTK